MMALYCWEWGESSKPVGQAPCYVRSSTNRRLLFSCRLSEDDAVKGKVHFIKLDVDEVPDVAKDLGIRAMPTFLLFENGDKSDELVGANPTALIQKVKTFAS